MGRRISGKSKVERKMGEGEGACYKLYITTSAFNSTGTTSVVKDWKTGKGKPFGRRSTVCVRTRCAHTLTN